MAVRYENKFKFKIVFAFVVLYSIAWFDHPRGSKFDLLNLFFVTWNPPWITWEGENRSTSTRLKMSLTCPVKNSTVESSCLKKI